MRIIIVNYLVPSMCGAMTAERTQKAVYVKVNLSRDGKLRLPGRPVRECGHFFEDIGKVAKKQPLSAYQDVQVECAFVLQVNPFAATTCLSNQLE